MKNLTLKQIKELCLFFNELLVQKTGMPASLFVESNNLIEKAYLNSNEKILRSAETDIIEQFEHMPNSLSIEFKRLILENLDINIELLDISIKRKISKILKRKRIVSEDEYNLILSQLSKDTDDKKEIDLNNRLKTLTVNYIESKYN